MKTKQRKDKILKEQKQKNYVVNWNIADGKKQYDALDDVFASYYFANPNVKKHLKHFSKVAKKEPKTTDLLRMTFLLDNKYKKSVSREDKYTHYLDRQKQNSSLKSQKINYHHRLQQPKSLQKIRKQQKIDFEPQNSKDQHVDMSKVESCNQNRLPKVKQHKIYQSQDEINRQVATKKKVFLQYLEKKKQQIKNKGLVS